MWTTVSWNLSIAVTYWAAGKLHSDLIRADKGHISSHPFESHHTLHPFITD